MIPLALEQAAALLEPADHLRGPVVALVFGKLLWRRLRQDVAKVVRRDHSWSAASDLGGFWRSSSANSRSSKKIGIERGREAHAAPVQCGGGAGSRGGAGGVRRTPIDDLNADAVRHDTGNARTPTVTSRRCFSCRLPAGGPASRGPMCC